MIGRFITTLLSVLTGIFAYLELIKNNINDAESFSLATAVYGFNNILVISLLNIDKQKFLSKKTGKLQIDISIVIGIFQLIIFFFLYLLFYYKWLFLVVLYSFAQICFISNFSYGTFNQFRNVDKFWNIQLIASIVRFILVLLIFFFSQINSSNLVLIFIIINFLIALLNSNGKAFYDILYIPNNIIFTINLFKKRYLWKIFSYNITNGLLRSQRQFIETGFLPIFAKIFLLSKDASIIIILNPIISSINNAFRSIFYKIDLKGLINNYQSFLILLISLSILISSNYFENLNFSFLIIISDLLFNNEININKLLFISIIYSVILFGTLGWIRIEITNNSILYNFYKFFFLVLFFIYLIMWLLEISPEFYFIAIPIASSIALRISKNYELPFDIK